MKLLTKIKIFYVVLCIIPIILMGFAVAVISTIGMNSIEGQYGIEQSTGLEAYYNPFVLLKHTATEITSEVDGVIDTNPDKLSDLDYLNELNEGLKKCSSFLVLKKEDTVLFSGGDKESQQLLDKAYLEVDSKRSNFIVLETVPFHIQQRRFEFSDGRSGRMFIITKIDQMVPKIKNTMLQMIMVISFIFIIAGALLVFWMYRYIISPVGRLKKAAENIKEGNLNFSVQAQKNDEIGELCVAFEEMRVKLKEQIEISMQYEKDNKELISNISHDLKTPITAIRGYIEGIMDGVADTPQKQEKYLKTVYAKATDMQYLIEELFLYSKLDSNSMAYSFRKVNLNDYFEDCIEEISMDLESKDIGLGFFNYVDKGCVIIADPEQLKRVIINIVMNSAKYIDKPKGIINIRLHDEPEFVQIEIEDNGQGIAPSELPHIFERCYRTDASRNSSKGGSGLGLSIAKKIIEEHGGRIWATSKVGIGTSICFVIRKYEETKSYEQ